MKNFVTLDDISNDQIMALIKEAVHYKQTGTAPDFAGFYISNLFYENSTRTKLSFEMAEKKSGMQVIHFDVETSSVKKGETLYDTVRTLESIGVQAVVVRHGQERYYDELIGHVGIPVISGGDGCGDHPSQSLLDLVTIYEEFGTFEGLKVVIAGDILHSRVAHSNAKIMKRLGAELFFATPAYWQDASLREGEFVHLDDVIETADVVMLLRIQNERHAKSYNQDNFLDVYGLSKEREAKMKTEAIIMHPAPINRDVEIDGDLIESEKSRIFPQMNNGVYARMAILNYALKGE
ncbi:aspartate carbamoyltransferase catalytic subunit [Culicoidibacter larvae]|uniref:Aspartate carbamoyltransferase n=1 Tax=Culicoidibacter larvae TaxID=2579976 RepID=A0A5R8QBZ3_9FIRM|nr:aspartate carbamoyltransferase catalytic subunit [Culicoidibacter larvae]TLG73810.1 aspartate carbamoyltransferase catalytic subunit [Culicoidibacter larvae]